VIFAGKDSIRLLADGVVIIAGRSITAATALLLQLVKKGTSLVEVHDECPCDCEPGYKYHHYGVDQPG